MPDKDIRYLIKEMTRTINAADSTAAYCLCQTWILEEALKLMKEQERRINELEEKLRLLEYGDQDILQSGMMPAT